MASDGLVDTRLAEIKVTIIACRAVVVNIRDSALAVVAADGKSSVGGGTYNRGR